MSKRVDKSVFSSMLIHRGLLSMKEGQTLALVSPSETKVFRLEKVIKREYKHEGHPAPLMWWYDEEGEMPFDGIKLVYGV